MSFNGSDDVLSAAIQNARYNEAVIVTVSSSAENNDNREDKIHNESDVDAARTTAADAVPSREIVLVATLDEENGGIVWRDATQSSATVTSDAQGAKKNGCEWQRNGQSNDNGRVDEISDDVSIVRHLRTKRWVLPMLNDDRRNKLYDAAIREACLEALRRLARATKNDKEQGTEEEEEKKGRRNAAVNGQGGGSVGGDFLGTKLCILDIGSGTGLLAMLAARHSLEALYSSSSCLSESKDTHNADKRSMEPTSDARSHSNSDKVADTANRQRSTSLVSVTSIEMASAMAKLANLTVSSNNLQDVITVVEGHSCDASFQLSQKDHVCTSELLESGLLGEGILPAIRDAWERHLHRTDAIVVPRCARVFAQVLEGRECIGHYRGPRVNILSSGFTSDKGNKNDEETGSQEMRVKLCTSSNPQDVLLGLGHSAERYRSGILVPLHAKALLGTAGTVATSAASEISAAETTTESARPLTDATMVLEFDFTSMDTIPPKEGRSQATCIIPTDTGTAHGVLFWWELDLWEGMTYSTKVGEGPWQDHWQQCLFVFPMDHDDCPKITKGESFELVSSHDDYSISFEIHQRVDHEDDHHSPKRQRLEERLGTISAKDNVVEINRHISPERALQLNDVDRLSKLRLAVRTAIEIKGRDVSVLDLSDFSLCAIFACTTGQALHVTSLESSSGNLPLLSAKVAQLGNGLLPQRMITNPDGTLDQQQFQIIHAHPENISLDLLFGRPAEIIMSEPYYELLEGWHLQEALNYFYLVRALKRRGLISPSAISVPVYASVMGCAVQFDDVYRAYRGLQAKNGESLVCGFRHDLVDMYGDRYHEYDASLPLWQYEHKKLTDSFELARIMYEGGISANIENNGEWSKTQFIHEGVCHALICWIEYGIRIHNDTPKNSNGRFKGDDCVFETISTATKCHRQAVRMLRKPVVVTKADVGTLNFCCRVMFGGLPGCEDHGFEFKVER